MESSQSLKDPLSDYELVEIYNGGLDESPPQTIANNTYPGQELASSINSQSFQVVEQSEAGARQYAPMADKNDSLFDRSVMEGAGEIRQKIQNLSIDDHNKTVINSQRSSSIKTLVYDQFHCSINASDYAKEIEVLLQKEDGKYLERNQTLLKVLFQERPYEPIDEQRISDTEIEPHVYNFFFLHSGVARFIELYCKKNNMANMNSLDFCKQQREKRQQLICQFDQKELQELHQDQIRIFLIDQSIESFKRIYKFGGTIKPQYEGQDIAQCLKQIKPKEQAHAIVQILLKEQNAMEFNTNFSQGIVIGD